MKIIVPMAGTGDRFVKAGYRDPKPLIKIDGKMIIEYILDMFDKDDDFIFICNETHLATTDMRDILKRLAPNSKILSIPNHKKGPVFTFLDSGVTELLEDDEEVIVTYCDNPYLWDYDHFKKWVKENDSDGCVMSHTGFHPHRLSPTFMAHIKETNLKIEAIKEKEPYTDDPMSEQASTGTYYFKKSIYIKKYFQMLIDQNINYNGEFYVTLVYNLLIRDGLNVHCYPTDLVMVFGTPEEVSNFEAWASIIKGSQVKNKEHVQSCYDYWKFFHQHK